MKFADGTQEWIYRGSSRLDAVYRSKHNPDQVPPRSKPAVPPPASRPALEQRVHAVVRPKQSERLAAPRLAPKPAPTILRRGSGDSSGKTTPRPDESRRLPQPRPIETKPPALLKKYIPHECGPECRGSWTPVARDTDPKEARNPLLLPIDRGWHRITSSSGNTARQVISYRAPCARTLRSMFEVDRYIVLVRATDLLSIDHFSFESEISVSREYHSRARKFVIHDLSNGTERIPIRCSNEYDNNYPPYIKYIAKRYPLGFKINDSPEFLAGCSCTDGCRDRSKCECIQSTIAASRCRKGGRANQKAGYQHHRLLTPAPTGIYECNVNCACAADYVEDTEAGGIVKACHNRVVQNGILHRIEVFKTQRRGWGIRCLDDVPQGGFLCLYVGQITTEEVANADGNIFGDDYLAELDHIEVVERAKLESDGEMDSGAECESLAESSDEDVPSSTSREESGGDSSVEELEMEVVKGSDTDNQDAAVTRHMRKLVGVRQSDYTSDDNASENKTGANGGAMTVTSVTGGVAKEAPSPSSRPRNRARKTMTNRTPRPGGLSVTGPPQHSSTRSMFGEGNTMYIMDAKSLGNVGRYLNHSCAPNCFVQSVYVDTHDLRLHWISFFALDNIKAGEELTWDYGYEIGSVDNKIMHCRCEAKTCRGRLY